jgi:exodeoxyribonuclease V alpha subunit
MVDQLGPEQIKGELRFVRFHEENSGFTVAAFASQADRTITAVGTMAQPRAGQWYLLWGRWTTHPQYGQQFEFERYELCAPATREGAVRYLSSGAIQGVGQEMAERLVTRFGTEVTDVLDREPERLAEVRGIGPRKLQAIIASWHREKNAHQAMMFLLGHGIGPRLAVRIYKRLREKTVEAVSENPYLLIREIEGVGFATADRMASSLGIAPDAPQRLSAGAIYTLQRALDEGHVFLPREVLVREAQRILGAEEDPVESAVQTEVETGGLIADESLAEEALAGQAIYIPALHSAERAASAHLLRLLKAPAAAEVPEARLRSWASGEPASDLTREAESGTARRAEKQAPKDAASGRGLQQKPVAPTLPLSGEQAKAVALALSSKVSVITGGPGVGKTTVARAIVELAEQAGAKAKLASPTGRAAKRLSEAAGRPAQTIHRLLDFDPLGRLPVPGYGQGASGQAFSGAFRRDEQSPLSADLVLVDEASMLDLPLACSLLRALPDRARLIFVGDVDQLPAVGPGLFLKDLIASGCVPVARLTEIFRQARESLIVTNAHRVNAGRWPVLLPMIQPATLPAPRSGIPLGGTGKPGSSDLPSAHGEAPGRAGDETAPRTGPSTPLSAGAWSSAKADAVRRGSDALAANADCLFIEEPDPVCLIARLKELCSRLLPERGFPAGDIQILTPMNKGQLGTVALNGILQQALNPPSPSKAQTARGQRIFREGDRVIQMVNNYQRGEGVFNGDIGRVARIRGRAGEEKNGRLWVEFPEQTADYSDDDLEELELAYALSVHKAQGSEFPAAIVICHSSQWFMLQRNLFYTALSRARRLAVVIGERRAVGRAVRNDREVRRYSALAWRLKEAASLAGQA